MSQLQPLGHQFVPNSSLQKNLLRQATANELSAWYPAGMKNKSLEWFSLDYRSLAILRIGMGAIILLDLIQRAEDLRAFYSDEGVLPRAQFLQLWNNQWWISLHMASGLWQFQAILFIIAGIFESYLFLNKTLSAR